MIDPERGGDALVTVTDLRQYAYCPRVVYFTGMLPRPLTRKMREGIQAHTDEEDRERRRSLRPYRLVDGERQYGVRLEDTALGLRGMLDMLVLREDEVIPIEHKMSEGPISITHRIQLQAYGLLVAAAYGVPARRGFVYWIPRRQATEVPFSPELAARTIDVVARVRTIKGSEALPEPTSVLPRCTDCEYRRFCGDRPRPVTR